MNSDTVISDPPGHDREKEAAEALPERIDAVMRQAYYIDQLVTIYVTAENEGQGVAVQAGDEEPENLFTEIARLIRESGYLPEGK